MSTADFCPNTPEEVAEMLAAIGVSGIDDLFAPIPSHLRAKSFNLPKGMSEFEVYDKMKALAGKNANGLTCFIGGGFYEHLIPSTVNHLSGRAEFYTAYTPYQPECSQGTLQALFEYQTAICRLTGMEASNASLYDGATALAEGAVMALRITGRNRLVVDGCINPFSRQVVRTYLENIDVEIVEVPPAKGEPDRAALFEALNGQTAAVLVQNPTFFGSVHDLTPLAEAVHAAGGLLIASVYPISLGMVKTPGEMGADIVVGDGQSLGNPLSFGGPSFGFIAAVKKYIRNLPGRIVGETIDRDGKRGFVLTLQAREQHIKRHKATSNICSNQSLCALRGLIFLASLGKKGLTEMAELNYAKAEYAKRLLSGVKGVRVVNTAPTFNEFTLELPKPADELVTKLLKMRVAAGVPAGEWYRGMENYLVVTVTESRKRHEIETFAKLLGGAL